jgi:hypothetical protein
MTPDQVSQSDIEEIVTALSDKLDDLNIEFYSNQKNELLRKITYTLEGHFNWPKQ